MNKMEEARDIWLVFTVHDWVITREKMLDWVHSS